MDTFRLFLENLDPSTIVDIAQQARQEADITTCARFGDCKDVSNITIKLLKQRGIKAQLKGGYFSPGGENGDVEHSWIVIDGFILDPTIDQFFSELDVDMDTKVKGIYYSHHEWDGDKYENRYNKYPKNYM
jgi:hypothetical protein